MSRHQCRTRQSQILNVQDFALQRTSADTSAWNLASWPLLGPVVDMVRPQILGDRSRSALGLRDLNSVAVAPARLITNDSAKNESFARRMSLASTHFTRLVVNCECPILTHSFLITD